MKKIIALVVAIIMALACVAAIAESKGTLKLATNVQFPPYEFYDDETGEPTGIDIEAAKLICEKIGYDLEIVDIDFDAGIVYVDGKALEETYVNSATNLQEDFDGEVTVPKGCVFVMGDNRNKSTDSRDARIGFVDTRQILGRVIFRLTPFSRFGSMING